MTDYYYLEIGTCDNTYNNLSTKYPDKYGISVEPIKSYLETLPDNNGNNIKVPFAIGEKNGTAVINKCVITKTKTKLDGSGWKGRSTLKDLDEIGIRHKHRFKTEIINTITLDTLIKRYYIAKLYLIRIDTEGYDGIIVNQLLDSKLRPKKLIYEHIHLNSIEKTKLKDRLSKIYKLTNTTYLDDYWELI